MNMPLNKEIDARGLMCPRPLIMAKQEIKSMAKGQLTILVDNATAVANLAAYAETAGLAVHTEQRGADFAVSISKEGVMQEITPVASNITVLISTDCFGGGDEQFSKTLMRNYIFALTEVEPKPNTMLFVNAGAAFTCEGSPVLDSLRILAESGTELLTCGACLDFYNIKLAVGQVTNMYVIAEKLLTAGQVIRV